MPLQPADLFQNQGKASLTGWFPRIPNPTHQPESLSWANQNEDTLQEDLSRAVPIPTYGKTRKA